VILTLKAGATEKQIQETIAKIEELGFNAHTSKGAQRVTLGVIGQNASSYREVFEGYDWIESVTLISKPYKLASREWKKSDTVVSVDGLKIGAKMIVVAAGPCAVENSDILLQIAKAVKKVGATMLRGGAFKPRTSPYSFQGLGEDALKMLGEARAETGLKVVTEVMSPAQIELVSRYADMLQIGARNMQNYDLLKEVGQVKKPVLLKRGISATIEELLMSAEYILSQGNKNVVLCERGIRTFETSTRFTLDLNAVPVIKRQSHLPVIVDPSHGTGVRNLVPVMAGAAIAAGADGLLIEVHIEPNRALSDGKQSIYPETLKEMMEKIRVIAECLGREI
jgi:3-deoxy-7-phosphoheptulonate synthase